MFFGFAFKSDILDSNTTWKVTRSVDTHYGQLSAQEQSTINAIVKARFYFDQLSLFSKVIYAELLLKPIHFSAANTPYR